MSLINGATFDNMANYEQNNLDKNELEIIHSILDIMKDIIFADKMTYFKKLDQLESQIAEFDRI